MSNLSELIGHWGYAAIFVIQMFGNAGVPAPEETVLGVAGYLVWRGQLKLPAVLAVAIAGAVLGDNLGYWLGRRFGREALLRYAHWVLGRRDRVERMQAFVVRRGALAVFLARFVPGVRTMAGPLAGASGVPFLSFLTANILGAAIWVPVGVGAGYAVGYGFGEYVERLRRTVGEVERLVLVLALLAVAALIAWHVAQALRARSRP